MVINPERALAEGWIKFPLKGMDDNQLQPNGIDLRIRQAAKLDVGCKLEMFNCSTNHAKQNNVETRLIQNKKCFFLPSFSPHLVETYEYISVPKDVVALVFGRSTLNRNGVILRASIYDSGFENFVGFVVYPFINFTIETGTRIAQVVFQSAETSHMYEGQYGISKNKELPKM